MTAYFPACSFRELLDKWDSCLAVKEEKEMIGNHLDQNGCIMFFKRDNEIFGAPEESRLAFAKIKSPDEDNQWKKEAKFLAINLLTSLLGQPTQNLFGIKDLPMLKLIDRDTAIDELHQRKKKKKKKKKRDK